MSKIDTVVFDFGNVLVRWAPKEIINLTFSSPDNAEQLAKDIFAGDIWKNLNLGKLTEAEAKQEYAERYHLSSVTLDALFYYVKQTQILIYNTHILLEKLSQANYRLYALTDNVKEIVSHLRANYSFWNIFDGHVVSAEIGMMKPQKEIFQYLMDTYQVIPEHSVFLDDMAWNVQAASAMGFKTIHFTNADIAEQQLKAFGLVF
ncbi:HAD family hydrolase [Acinetobacter nectaris]|uniref:HAD family hydrolase n=1 Tax=Acinetobacter nectaris TaxID=1219382 RepID=UPI001F1A3903|nr:HAD family phosphatase [Acinetobacter nectaris]MCF9046394.1 HAD family phosphatase [Acinetobacter nectaris]